LCRKSNQFVGIIIFSHSFTKNNRQPMNFSNKTIDVLSVGELLIDLISTDFAENFEGVENFKRIPGGSPANLGMNMMRLGNRVRLVACVGQDAMGGYLSDYVQSLGFDMDSIQRVSQPTTLILVTRSQKVSDFEAYRGADCQISATQLSDEMLAQAKIFHTTCFALSKKPAQTNILNAAKRATELGCKLSIDANYAQKIWQNRKEARKTVAEYVANGAFVKISEVDWERLYGNPLTDPKMAAQHFVDLGASEVCVTLGGDGCYIASALGGQFLPARKVEVKDTTGAGDAFWSGYLTARLDGHELLESAMAGRRMAELKLAHFGPLPKTMERTKIYEDFKALTSTRIG
jgi:fructokinase